MICVQHPVQFRDFGLSSAQAQVKNEECLPLPSDQRLVVLCVERNLRKDLKLLIQIKIQENSEKRE